MDLAFDDRNGLTLEGFEEERHVEIEVDRACGYFDGALEVHTLHREANFRGVFVLPVGRRVVVRKASRVGIERSLGDFSSHFESE